MKSKTPKSQSNSKPSPKPTPRSARPVSGTILQVSRLCIRRGRTVILRDVNWIIRPGQHWVILGANGSGKTSLLSALTGYLTPTDGDITVLDQRYGGSDWRDLRLHIGMVSSSIRQLMAESEPALESVVSGKYAMIDLWGRATPRDRKEGMRILRQIECTHLADRPWSVLSQGERQRILIGRALMARPRLLILDEPCAGLDPVAREHFLQWLNRLGKNPDRPTHSPAPTLVLVTHHVEEIMPIFTHALLLKKGRVLAADRKPHVLQSALLSEAFGAPLHLSRSRGRHAMQVRPTSRVVI